MELTQDDVIRILKLIDESPMGRVSLQVGDLKLEVEKGTSPGSASAISERVPRPAAAGVPEAKPAEAASIERGVQDNTAPKQSPGADENFLTIKAPLLGIFYRRSQPGAQPYVEEGSIVDEDTTVALIEVMKLFNSVKAGVKGRIYKICVENNDLVEYEQVLFLVKPE
jgi:acetyl-CoA carboxylase biotin carboxyl carrier protein